MQSNASKPKTYHGVRFDNDGQNQGKAYRVGRRFNKKHNSRVNRHQTRNELRSWEDEAS